MTFTLIYFTRGENCRNQAKIGYIWWKKKPDIRMNMQLKTLLETDVVIGIV